MAYDLQNRSNNNCLRPTREKHGITIFFPEMDTIDWANVPYHTVFKSADIGSGSTGFQLSATYLGKQTFGFRLHLLAAKEETVSITGRLLFNEFGRPGVRIFYGDLSIAEPFRIGVLTVAGPILDIVCEVNFEEWTFPKLDPAFEHQVAFMGQMAKHREEVVADMILAITHYGVLLKEFPIHKYILSLRSPVFAAMFSHENCVENVRNRIEIEDIDVEVMEALLKYIYECKVQGIEEIAGDLLSAADKYDMPLLVQECIKVMSANLSVLNAAQYFYISDLHKVEPLKDQIRAFIAANSAQVRQSDGFQEYIFPKPDLLVQFIDSLL